ncbi:hypothetical protein FJW07_19785 [Mesorhizobium sp. B3-1-9]|uniref:hypothetical protein n=1 Tax=unclassified Mesorhizobium TaxID=325217 RepID=UPI001127B6A9|nr:MULTISPECIES: hypothetical protein [unclassified Mesorhizobium]TPI36831.1 hypothetical protein FJW07_19785 [Mesorhizobium sp. B3-1-9]TPJ37001.1 hypothetical protein FJ418_01640 [Mesorhizobium sp. B2-8-3]
MAAMQPFRRTETHTMMKSPGKSDPVGSESSNNQAKRQTETLPEQDPAEGSRKTVDRELERQKRSPGAEDRKSGRQALRDQVDEETELPQKGSA